MTSRKTIGIVITVLGLLMTCCACPLAVNSMGTIANMRTSIYGQIFQRLGPRIGPYAYNGQVICIGVLALIVLVVGIVVLIQARGNGTTSN